MQLKFDFYIGKLGVESLSPAAGRYLVYVHGWLAEDCIHGASSASLIPGTLYDDRTWRARRRPSEKTKSHSMSTAKSESTAGPANGRTDGRTVPRSNRCRRRRSARPCTNWLD